MAGYEDEALQIQITVFEEHKLADESQMPMMSHQELFDKLRKKVNLDIYLLDNKNLLRFIIIITILFQGIEHVVRLVFAEYFIGNVRNGL